mgnify:CR=1 FL=1
MTEYGELEDFLINKTQFSNFNVQIHNLELEKEKFEDTETLRNYYHFGSNLDLLYKKQKNFFL